MHINYVHIIFISAHKAQAQGGRYMKYFTTYPITLPKTGAGCTAAVAACP